jgi:NADPH2:quinone reductase
LLPAEKLFPLPEGVSFETGASLLMTYGTNMHGLLDRGHLKAGDTLLVLGAAGGVGLAAVELGKAYGARVVAAVSSEEKAAAARERRRGRVVIYPARHARQGPVQGAGRSLQGRLRPRGRQRDL